MKELIEKLGNGNVYIVGIIRGLTLLALFLGSTLLGILSWLGAHIYDNATAAKNVSDWNSQAIVQVGNSLQKTIDVLDNVNERLSRLEGEVDGHR